MSITIDDVTSNVLPKIQLAINLCLKTPNKSQKRAENMIWHKSTSKNYKWDTKKLGVIKQVKLLNEISYEMTDFAMKFLRKKYFFWPPSEKGIGGWFLNKWICLNFMSFSSK